MNLKLGPRRTRHTFTNATVAISNSKQHSRHDISLLGELINFRSYVMSGEAQRKWEAKNPEKKKEYASRWYQKNREKVKEDSARNYEKNKAKRMRRSTELKQENKLKIIAHMGGKCRDCKGTFLPGVYDLHHIDPKTKDKDMHSITSFGWERMLVEAEKCVLLCANCHRTRHIKEKHG
jgi:hypothetical protein